MKRMKIKWFAPSSHCIKTPINNKYTKNSLSGYSHLFFRCCLKQRLISHSGIICVPFIWNGIHFGERKKIYIENEWEKYWETEVWQFNRFLTIFCCCKMCINETIYFYDRSMTIVRKNWISIQFIHSFVWSSLALILDFIRIYVKWV